MKTLGDETLRGKVIAFVKIVLADHMEDRGITLQAGWVKGYLLQQMFDPGKTSLRIFERDPPNQPMDFVPQIYEVLRKIAAVLPGNAGNQSLLFHLSLNSRFKCQLCSRKASVAMVLRSPKNMSQD